MTAVLLTVVTDAALASICFLPVDVEPEGYTFWVLFVALVYRTVFTVLGGFVIVKLAPHNPMKHVFVIAVVSLLLGIGAIFAEWDMFVHWFLIAQAVLAFPSVWYGGKLALFRHSKIPEREWSGFKLNHH